MVTNSTPRKNSKISLLSFDLDNALYDNQPVIEKAEADSADYLAQQFQLQHKKYQFSDFLTIRQRLLATDDIRFEDLSFFRQTALKSFCRNLENSEQIAARAFEIFIQARSLATIPLPIFKMLDKLSQHYTLVSVTNGNCDAKLLSIANFFDRHYSATCGVRAKPHHQMLLKVAKDFNVNPKNILHIGDSVEKDGGAAKAAGANFYHFEPFRYPQTLALSCQKLLQTIDEK